MPNSNNCQIVISDVQSNPPYTTVGWPTTILVRGYVTGDCEQVIITVRDSPNGQLLFPEQSVATTDNITLVNQREWLIQLDLDPNYMPHTALPCGIYINVDVYCATNSECAATRFTELACKKTDDHNSIPPERPTTPPFSFSWCRISKQLFATLLVAFLLSVLDWLCSFSVSTNNVMITSAILMSVAMLLMLYLCPPSPCLFPLIFCWAFKWATILGVGISIYNACLLAGIGTALFGMSAGILEIILVQKKCQIPSVRSFPI